MTDQLPADIAEAIKEFQNACYGLAVNGAKGFESKEDAMRAALDAVILKHIRGEWHDIGSAPTDGRHVLVARTGVSPARAWYEDGRWWLHGCGPNSRNIADLTGPYAPTHWRFMPRPPAAALAQHERSQTEG